MHTPKSRHLIEFLLIAALLLILFFSGSGTPAVPFPVGPRLIVADFDPAKDSVEPTSQLRQILVLSLHQSSIFVALPQSKLRDALQLAFRDPNAPLTPARVREVCLREGIPAYLVPRLDYLQSGSIATLSLVAVRSESDHEIPLAAVMARHPSELPYAMEELGKRARRALGENRDSPALAGTLFPTRFPQASGSPELFAEALSQCSRAEHDPCITSLEGLVAQNPEFSIARTRLAALYRQLGLMSPALEQMSHASEFATTLPLKEKLRFLGTFDSMHASYPEAQRQFEALVRLFPNDWESHFDLADMWLSKGNTRPAIDGFHKALSLNDNHIESYVGLSQAYMLNDNTSAAREAWRQAFALEPDNFQVLLAGGMIELMENNLAGASDKFQRIASSASTRVRSFGSLLLAQAQIYGGRFQSALATLNEGITEDVRGGNPIAEADKRLLKAQTDLLLGNFEQATSECRGLPFQSLDAVRLGRAGVIYARGGRAEMAKEILRRIQDNADHRFQVILLQGEIELAAHRADAAVRLFEQAKALQPVNLPFEPLARALATAGFPEKAAREYLAVCQNKPAMMLLADSRWFPGTWVRALYDAGILLEQRGRQSEARQMLRNYIWVFDGADPDLPTYIHAKAMLKAR